MKKIIGASFLLIGSIMICLALFQILSANKEVEETLASAEQLIQQESVKHASGEASVNREEIANDYQEGDTIGILEVPKIKEKLPIVEGTDDNNLKKGVGHYTGTALPTEGEQIVLSGHRDTVFAEFDRLEIGDKFIVELPYGSFTYEIRDTEIVDAGDRTVIRPRSKEVLTVTTCYPFRYVGNAPDRFIFYAYPMKGDV